MNSATQYLKRFWSSVLRHLIKRGNSKKALIFKVLVKKPIRKKEKLIIILKFVKLNLKEMKNTRNK